MSENDSKVRCKKCGRTQEVNYSACIRRGWPKCCDGLTMRLISKPTEEMIHRAVGDALQPLSVLRETLDKKKGT